MLSQVSFRARNKGETMRQAIVAGNWKMHGSPESTTRLLEGLKQGLPDLGSVHCVVFPPYVFIDQTAQLLQGTTIAFGAQNVSANEQGAYTGEVSADMLTALGCEYVLVGHSERRALYQEDDILVAMKFAQAKQHGLIPILCVGETLEQRQAGVTRDVVARQLDAILNLDAGISGFKKAVVAYEPIWAIGTGVTATPEQAQEVHQMIREKIAGLDKEIAEDLSILYGGSVKAANARELFAMPDIDGGLVGGASLQAEEYVEIVKCIN